MRRPIRTITVMVTLGLLTSAASVFLIAYWPRAHSPASARLDRDRRTELGEGRGYLALRYDTGFGFQLASGTASQQFIIGGYTYASTTQVMPWPASVARIASPWEAGEEPWPADGVSRQVMVLRVGWPAPMLEGEWSQTLTRPRPGPPPLPGQRSPDEPTNVITTRNWRPTRPMWTAYGGWAYVNTPAWLKSSRLGEMVFNKSMLQAVPTRPLWTGLIVNTVLFAGAWWGVIALAGRARRAFRAARTRGRCEHCRYPRAGLDADAPCPECGKRPGRDSNPRPAV